ncbi:hypothetical protein EB796_000025 [Bugula neritina]|uniref:Uncharacterized protein n=1 Tax=Bugula neritina TaxID=10212 RepID=A0A7J7KU04_BUGNE|nr:hypothetical protein EB796_000025 [Bugula neritina]
MNRLNGGSDKERKLVQEFTNNYLRQDGVFVLSSKPVLVFLTSNLIGLFAARWPMNRLSIAGWGLKDNSEIPGGHGISDESQSWCMQLPKLHSFRQFKILTVPVLI